MAGAMRRMGIYLGLVEDDDPRGYGRYDSRQSDHLDDRRYGRYAADDYDAHYQGDYPPGAYADDDLEAVVDVARYVLVVVVTVVAVVGVPTGVPAVVLRVLGLAGVVPAVAASVVVLDEPQVDTHPPHGSSHRTSPSAGVLSVASVLRSSRSRGGSGGPSDPCDSSGW